MTAKRLSDEEALSHLRPATSKKGGFFTVFLGKRKPAEKPEPAEKRKEQT